MPQHFAHRYYCASYLLRGIREGAPEIDAFMWVRKDEAVRMVFKSQSYLFK
jgi:hypothetical protein